jgi:hypothetical protein
MKIEHKTEILTLYANYDFSKFAFDCAIYKIFEAGHLVGESTLIFSNGSGVDEERIKKEIGNRMGYEFIDSEIDFWMIVDPEEKFVFFSYGA